MRLNKKGLEMIWWTVIVIVIAVIIIMIFFYFMRSGFLQIGGLSERIFGTPEQFINKS